jgi:RHS repeat-associated protein
VVEVRNWLIAGAEQVLTYPQPAVKLLNGTTPAAATYLHRDALGSVRAITSAAGAKIEAAVYKPFGEQSEWVLPGNAAPETKGWIGERYDADAGLQYLNARYYDPALGLFLQPDWFEVTKAGVGTNRFSYSFNDPVNKLDPGGNQTADPKLDDQKSRERAAAREQIRQAARTTRLATPNSTASPGTGPGLITRLSPLGAFVAGLGIGPLGDGTLTPQAESYSKGAALPAGLIDQGWSIDQDGNARDPDGEVVLSPSSSGKGWELSKARQRHGELIDARVAELEALGYQVTKEVSFMTGNKTARLDIVASLNGVPMLGIEGKTGNGGLVRNQPDVFGAFEDGSAVPFGPNAARAGFNLGVPIGQPMPFEILRGF